MLFYCKVTCKDKDSLKYFCDFLKQFKIKTYFLQFRAKKIKKKFVTVLKSPHVNKTAQEQFEFRYYSREFYIKLIKPFQFLVILKKTLNESFSDLDVQFKILSMKPKNSHILQLIDLNEVHKTEELLSPNKVFNYIKLFDAYGECFLAESLNVKV